MNTNIKLDITAESKPDLNPLTKTWKEKEEPEGLYYACPFYAVDRYRFCSCGNSRPTSFTRLKEHLGRQHCFGKTSFCMNCRQAWSTEEGFTNHQGNCEFTPIEIAAILSKQEYDFIGKMGSNDEEKWNHMWTFLFPLRSLPSCYHDLELTQYLRLRNDLPLMFTKWMYGRRWPVTPEMAVDFTNGIVGQLFPGLDAQLRFLL